MRAREVKIEDLIIIILFSRVLIFSVAVVSSVIVDWPISTPTVDVPVFGLFLKWDTGYYLDIAARGYCGKVDLWAFRPFYPLILRSLGYPFIEYLGATETFLIVGILWNIFAFTIAAVFLYELTKLLLDEKSARARYVRQT